jgi:hypothetical protein
MAFPEFFGKRLSASRAPSGPHTTPLAPSVVIISSLFLPILNFVTGSLKNFKSSYDISWYFQSKYCITLCQRNNGVAALHVCTVHQ